MLSDKNVFSPLVLSPSKKHGGGFWQFLFPVITTVLAIIIANQRHHRHVVLAMPERPNAYMWEQPCMIDFWKVVVHLTQELWIQHFRMTCSTFEELCMQ